MYVEIEVRYTVGMDMVCDLTSLTHRDLLNVGDTTQTPESWYLDHAITPTQILRTSSFPKFG